MTYDIYINSTIGWPFSAEVVRKELDKRKDKPCNVYISSLGGSVVDALQIRQMFHDHGDVTVHLHGFVASAATIIAMGAKTIRMGRYALFLIHRCSNWVDTWGRMNAEQIEQAIRELISSKSELETIDRLIANIYAGRCGRKVDEVAGWMKQADWLNAERCREMGLIDDICEDDERPEITDMVSRRLTACQYPIPDLAQKPAPTAAPVAAPADDLSFGSLLRTARDFIRGIATAQDHTGTPATQPHNQHTNNTSTTMNQTEPKNLLSALKVKDLAQEDGKVLLTAEQTQALDDHLDTLAAEAGKKDKEIENLKKQVRNLKQGDGDTTDDVDPDDNEDDTENYAVRARKAWNRLKTLG